MPEMHLIESIAELEQELNRLSLLGGSKESVADQSASGVEVPQRLFALKAAAGAATALSAEQYGKYGVYWASGDGSNIDEEQEESELQLAAFGAACQFSTLGPLPDQQVISQFNSFFKSLSQESLLPYLRVFGGESFIAGRDGSGCWADFGDSHFIIPEITYVDPTSNQSAQRATHTKPAFFLLLFGNQLQKNRARLEFVRTLLQGPCFHQQGTQAGADLSILEERSNLTSTEWASSVHSIQEQIAAGVVEKIVTARRVTLELSKAPQLPDILRRLSISAPRCTRFSFRIGSRILIAATPERLLRKRGLEVRTEALAGSISAKETDAAERLLGSEKNRKEHAFVVKAIHEALTPLCLKLEQEPPPKVRILKHVLHLQTPISGQLRSPAHILELISHLHPTPAVGGLPQAKALAWIVAHETSERGWYAAPFGWFDASGNGEFRVSLRSALVNENKVHLFAGAGIVKDSDANSEYAETEVKFISMRDALGLAETSS